MQNTQPRVSLITHFQNLPDPRVKRTKAHELIDLLGHRHLHAALRRHWGVENKLHWVLDVWFREDQSRARAGYAAQTLATLRRLALNLLKRKPTR